MLNLNQNDYFALEERGLTVSQVETQLHHLQGGMSPIQLLRPCRIQDGIIQFSSRDILEYHTQFQIARRAGRVSKFIPASGSATRMFNDLLQFLKQEPISPTTNTQDPTSQINLIQAWEQLQLFPFIDELRHFFKSGGLNFHDLYQSNQRSTIFQALLADLGLGYANLPKALLPFHRYPTETRSALEEHVYEALMYSHDTGHVQIHLTVSSQHEAQVKAVLNTIQQKINHTGKTIEVTISVQKSSTDTIALDSEGHPFRNKEGALIFRPGGHGALLDNLNDYKGDIIFISNIDNVVPDYLKEPIVECRKSLAGYLICLQKSIFHHLNLLTQPKPSTIEQAEGFARDELKKQFPLSFGQLPIQEKATQLKELFNRPIRVCGVVPNTGDSGGGPFWVQHTDGSQSRQIVEESQADSDSKRQHQLFASATHFNPVDMVCGVRDYQGNPFNLLQFRDQKTSFISHKTYEGRPLKALEWPGLWNGGMADWITLFVEIPRSNFNPVKTFLDWLQPTHQPATSFPISAPE